MKHFFFKLTWANLLARPLPTILTVATLAAAVALISILMQFSAYTSERLSRDLAGVDLVVGAKGSPLQLILSSLLHVDIPTGNIPLAEAQKIMKHQFVKAAVPVALGDSFRGFRIVGTNSEFLDLYQANLAKGGVWTKPQQVVIGSVVARQLDMKIGQRFVGAHGLSYSDADLLQHEHAAYEVVGILSPRASIIDRLIITSVDSVWHAHEEGTATGEAHDEGHDAEEHEDGHHDEEEHHEGHDAHDESEHHDDEDGHDEAGHHDEAEHHEIEHHEADHHDEDSHHHDELSNLKTMDPEGKAITALLVAYSSPIAAVRMPREINDQAGLQAASPALEITRLYNLSAGLMDAGKVLAIIMTFIGGLSIFVAVSNAAVHRTYDVALLRAMGARPMSIFAQQIYEGSIVALFSGILGVGFAHLSLFVAASIYEPLAVFGLNGGELYQSELYLLIGSVVVGMIAAIWPAISSYRVDPMLLLKGGR